MFLFLCFFLSLLFFILETLVVAQSSLWIYCPCWPCSFWCWWIALASGSQALASTEPPGALLLTQLDSVVWGGAGGLARLMRSLEVLMLVRAHSQERACAGQPRISADLLPWTQNPEWQPSYRSFTLSMLDLFVFFGASGWANNWSPHVKTF